MKSALNPRLAAVLGVSLVLASTPARADLVADAVTALQGLATPIASGAGALFAVTLVFMGLRYARRLASK